ncbi:unnamed protein product, partial [Ectocarpus sp. 13 AM-2016]
SLSGVELSYCWNPKERRLRSYRMQHRGTEQMIRDEKIPPHFCGRWNNSVLNLCGRRKMPGDGKKAGGTAYSSGSCDHVYSVQPSAGKRAMVPYGQVQPAGQQRTMSAAAVGR